MKFVISKQTKNCLYCLYCLYPHARKQGSAKKRVKGKKVKKADAVEKGYNVIAHHCLKKPRKKERSRRKMPTKNFSFSDYICFFSDNICLNSATLLQI